MKASLTMTHKQHWEKVAPKTLDLLDKAVRTTAFEVERGAKMRAPVDTGALRASIYTVTSRSTSYAGAIGSAKGRKAARLRKDIRAVTKGRSQAFKQGRTDREFGRANFARGIFSPAANRTAKMEALVACAVEYGIHLEFGTKKMPGRFFMKRAMQAQSTAYRGRLYDALRKGAQ